MVTGLSQGTYYFAVRMVEIGEMKLRILDKGTNLSINFKPKFNQKEFYEYSKVLLDV